ncbi:hypothetical protein D3C87_2130990 [compost metagenome]
MSITSIRVETNSSCMRIRLVMAPRVDAELVNCCSMASMALIMPSSVSSDIDVVSWISVPVAAVFEDESIRK